MLQGKKILLGVSGGIAAYKSCELLRLLQKQGTEVRVVMTSAALELVGEATFKALSCSEVLSPKNRSADSYFAHIDWARWADLLVVAPCTANSIGNFASGITPDILSLLWMSSTSPKLLVPSMNTAMFNSPAVQKNLEFLKNSGVLMVEPDSGLLACGEVGEGRYPSYEKIVSAIQNAIYPSEKSQKVVIAAGRTEEYMDSVRHITNKSSGKTALALASAFKQKNWDVHIVSGPIDFKWPEWCAVHSVVSAQEMFECTEREFKNAQALVMAAAVADFKPKSQSEHKIKGSASLTHVELVRNPDILQTLSAQKKANQVVVGFALETENIEKYAQEKIAQKKCDLLLVNNPVQKDSGFGLDVVQYCLIESSEDAVQLQLGSKSQLAKDLVHAVIQKYAQKTQMAQSNTEVQS